MCEYFMGSGIRSNVTVSGTSDTTHLQVSMSEVLERQLLVMMQQ